MRFWAAGGQLLICTAGEGWYQEEGQPAVSLQPGTVITIPALRAVPDGECMLELSNGLSPIVLTPCDDTRRYSYMVLPVRLKAGE